MEHKGPPNVKQDNQKLWIIDFGLSTGFDLWQL